MIHRYLQNPRSLGQGRFGYGHGLWLQLSDAGGPQAATLLARYKPADIRRVSGRFPLENSPVGTDSVLGCFSTSWYWIEPLWFTCSFNLGPVEGPFRDWPSSLTRGATGRNHPASYPLQPPPIAGARLRSEPAVRFPY